MAPFAHSVEPILTPQKPSWQQGRVYNPAAIVVGNRVALLYRAQGTQRLRARGRTHWPSVIGLAWSADGTRFSAERTPVLQPRERWERVAVEDPRIVQIGKRFVLTYTASDGVHARLAIATTADRRLRRWNTRSLLFPEEKRWTKAGALLPAKLNGRYYLYFQMHRVNAAPRETHIWLASSPDLRAWEIHPYPVLTARRGHFDDRLVEPGPPPLLVPEGILLIYNAAKTSRNLHGRTFAVGWALFDRHDPSQLLERCEEPILRVEHPTERHGRVPRVPFRKDLPYGGRITGTIFAEGLVRFRNRWFLYYGMGDSMIGVAVSGARRLFTEAGLRRPTRGRVRAHPELALFTDEDEPFTAGTP